MVAKIKVAEIFYSLQGEGRHCGCASIFLRTFGCNFTCSGFGMERGKCSEERNKIDPGNYSKYGDLPLVGTGCDSYASWDVRFKQFSPVLSIDEIAQRIDNLLPSNKWRQAHLVITGGEPLLGWQRAYTELMVHPLMRQCGNLTFETNGTQKLHPDLREFLQNWFPYESLTFSVSAKLPDSGQTWEEAIRPEIVKSYQDIGHTFLKFVVSNEQDFEDVDRAVKQYEESGFEGDVYCMPVGGVDTLYYENNKRVAEMAIARGYHYSPRLQVDLWKNAWAT